MAQKRYWNFEDDDRTFDLNAWRIGLIDAGRYRGYFAGFPYPAGLTLSLGGDPNDQIVFTDEEGRYSEGVDPLRTKWLSVAVTKQGVLVKETEAITVAVDSNPTANPRIDLVVLENQYQFINGGTPVIYKVIKGTPAASPVAPALPNPALQVILGRLYMPAGAASLDTVGVQYTPEAAPSFANNPDIVYRSKQQTVEAFKHFYSLNVQVQGASLVNDLVNNNLAKIRTFQPTIGFFNRYVVSMSGSSRRIIDGFTDFAPPPGLVVELIFQEAVTIVTGTNIVLPAGLKALQVNALEPVTLINMQGLAGVGSGVPMFYVHTNNKATTLYPSKYWTGQRWNAKTANLTGTGLIIDVTDMNTIELNPSGSGVEVAALKVPAPYVGITDGTSLGDPQQQQGMLVVIRNNTAFTVKFKHNQSVTASNGEKKFLLPNSQDIDMEPNSVLMLKEDLGAFSLVNYMVYTQSNLSFRTDRINRYTKQQQMYFIDIPNAVIVGGNLQLPRESNAYRIGIDGNVQIHAIADELAASHPTGTMLTLQFYRKSSPTSNLKSWFFLASPGGSDPTAIVNYLYTSTSRPVWVPEQDNILEQDDPRGATVVLVKQADGWNVVAHSRSLKQAGADVWTFTNISPFGTPLVGDLAFPNATWGNTGGSDPVLQLGVSNRGEVWLRGSVVAANSATTIIYKIPVGYRPARDLRFAVSRVQAGSPPILQPGVLTISASTGLVELYSTSGAPVATGLNVWLDNIRYPIGL